MTSGMWIIRVVGVISVLLVTCTASAYSPRIEIDPAVDLIARAWSGYGKRFIQQDGRVQRPRNSGDTVSEGQAYVLLIASLLDDRKTFDRVLDWTEAHLSRKGRTGDHLLAWHWEPGKGVTDWNSASDADLDYALALIIASTRWHDERYARKARLVMSDLLDRETEMINGQRYLLPGSWRKGRDSSIINPSYLSPAHFRIFFACTGDPRWNNLIEGSYYLIETASKRFAGTTGVGLVPDWLLLTADGALTRATGFSDRFSWDAIRTPWRLGMDAMWFGEDRARRYLDGMRDFYTQEWERRGNRFFAEYTYEGRPAGQYEHIAAYAMSLSALARSNSPVLTGVLGKLRSAFNKDAHLFGDGDDYYANSLVLLALIFYREGTLPTLDPRNVVCR